MIQYKLVAEASSDKYTVDWILNLGFCTYSTLYVPAHFAFKGFRKMLGSTDVAEPHGAWNKSLRHN